MNPISSLFFLLSLTLCLAVGLAYDPTSPTRLQDLVNATNGETKVDVNPITKACSRSTHKDFCLSVLQSNPDSKTADVKGLAFIAFKAAAKNATELSLQIKSLLNGKTTLEPTVEQGLMDCDDHYLDAIDQIDGAMAALSRNNFRDVDTWVKVAVSDVDACDGGIKGQTGPALEVSRKNRVVRQFFNNALSIAHVLGRY